MILDSPLVATAVCMRKKETFVHHKTMLALTAVALATGAIFTSSSAQANGPGLATLMERMQTYTHKLQLSVEARNGPLADFYLHELEEVAEYVVENIPAYGDYPIGELTREMMLPSIERLEDVVEAADWPAADTGFKAVLEACNACHVVTGHGFIRIAPAGVNPFAQDFSPAEAED